MKTTSIISMTVLLAAMVGSTACTPRDEQVGPAQKAGAAIDNAGQKVAEELHESLDKARDAGQQVTDGAKRAEERMQEATEDASEGARKTTEKVGEKVEEAGERIKDAAR
jgi:methyl-accepting chemotaxis protein